MSLLDEFQIDYEINDIETGRLKRITDEILEKKTFSENLKEKTEIVSLDTDSSCENKARNEVLKGTGKTRIEIIDGYSIEYNEPVDEEEEISEENMLEKQINNLQNKSLAELDNIMRNLYDELLYNNIKYSCFNNYFYKLNVFKSNRTFNLDKSIIVSNCDELSKELEIEKIFSTVGLIQQLYINRKNDIEETLKTILKYNYYSQLISNIHEHKDKFLENNSKNICLLKENEILVEYVDSVSCDLAVEAFKFTKIKGKTLIIRHAIQKTYNPIYLKIEGLDTKFINDMFLRSYFNEYSKKILEFTFNENASYFYITVQNNKTAKILLKNFHNKRNEIIDCILKVEIVPEIYIKTDKERWLNIDMIRNTSLDILDEKFQKLNSPVENHNKK